MNIPGFTGERSLYLSNGFQSQATRENSTAGLVEPQDCPWYKSIGCGLGPLSWCALAGLGGTESYRDCVDRLSGGNCLDCIGANRDPSGPLPPDNPYRGGLTSGPGVIVGPPPPSATRTSEIEDLRRQLNRIERCACGYKGVVPAPPPWLGVPDEIL